MSLPDSLVGSTLDRYALLEMIGEGGMGAVYLGEHTQIQRRVAVKVLHRHLASSQPDLALRMLNEAKAAAMIGHPGIVDVVDYGETPDGIHYLVMELLNGKELRVLLDEGRALSPAVAIPIIDHVLSALGAAHEIGIVHRDLKPDNIFLHVARTGLYEVKLLDFGISKFSANKEMRLTATGAVMGTPYYMSLEQAEGRTDMDHRTDIYAASVILYQALSGARPFDGENVNQVLVAILRGDFTPLGTLCPALSPALVDIVHRGMARDREQRYATVDELREALKPHWDPEDQSVVEAFRTVHGLEAPQRVGVLGASGRFPPAPATSLPPMGGPAPAPAPGPAPMATPAVGGDYSAQTVALRPAAPSGPMTPASPPGGAPQTTHAGAPQTTHAGAPQTTHPGTPQTTHPGAPQTTHPGTPQTTHPGTPQTTHPGTPQTTHPGTPRPFSIEQWLGQVSRERWIQIIKISILIIVVATTTALIATRGCETCGDENHEATVKSKKRKKSRRKKKKKKKKKEPEVIRRMRNLF